MKERKMAIKNEFADGRKLLQCSCGRQFMLNPQNMENAIYDQHGRIIGQCPKCGYDQAPDIVSRMSPPKRYGTLHITILARSDDRKSIEEKTIIAGLGQYTDFTAWAAKIICRLPDHLRITKIQVVDCTKEQYDAIHRQIVLSQMEMDADNLSTRSLFAALMAMALIDDDDPSEEN